MIRMRYLISAAALSLLAACGQKKAASDEASTGSPESSVTEETKIPAEAAQKLPAGFPKMTATYRAVYDLSSKEEGPKEATFEVDGARKLRFEMAHMNEAKAAKGLKLIGVFDDPNDRMLLYVDGPDAPKAALTLPQKEGFMDAFLKWGSAADKQPKKVGTDKIAGLSCDVWQTDDDGGEHQACLTSDGILLRAGDAGEEPTIVAREVKKGAIPDSRFAIPEGYEVVDMGPCQELMQKAATDAKAGKAPDMAAMMKCQAIGQKAAEIFGD